MDSKFDQRSKEINKKKDNKSINQFPSTNIDDQRILKSDWTRDKPGLCQPKELASEDIVF